MTPNNGLKNNPDPMAQGMAQLLRPIDACFGIGGFLIGAGVGGTVGGITWSVLGVRAVAKQPSTDSTSDANPIRTVDESTDEEVTRLRAKVARLQGRIAEIQDENRGQIEKPRQPSP